MSFSLLTQSIYTSSVSNKAGGIPYPGFVAAFIDRRAGLSVSTINHANSISDADCGPDIFTPHNPRSGPEALTVASILPATC
jgi:hypothetical protein